MAKPRAGSARRAFSILCALAALIVSDSAEAWNAAGHRLSAAVAWRCMDDASRSAVGRLLAQHPEYAAWLARSRSAATDETSRAYLAFIEASTWADDIKRDVRFHEEGTPENASQDGYTDMAQHRNWHYADQPIFSTPIQIPGVNRERTGDGELDLRLALLRHVLANPRESDLQRAYALVWLIHLVGDAHQPLHTVSRIDEEGRPDDGGNTLWIDNPFHPRRRDMTLHAYWDDLPGPPWLRGSRLEKAADRLQPLAGNPRSPGSVSSWMKEGRELAASVVYEGLIGEVSSLSSDYHERAQRTAQERVAIAGMRLALVLQAAFGNGKPH